MARPKSSSGGKQLFKEFTSAELWSRLNAGMKRSGMLQAIVLEKDLKRRLEEEVAYVHTKYPKMFDMDKNAFMYQSRVQVVRHLLKTDNNWMIRWVSDPKRLAKVNIVKEEFLKYGPEALPSYYKHALKHGAVFRWAPNARKTIIMMVRGLGKTHNDLVVRSIKDFVNDPSEKCLIGHGTDDKAVDNLKRIRDALFHPNLQIVFPEMFTDDRDMYRNRGVEITKGRINMKLLDFEDMYKVIDPSDYMRGEATWNLFTPLVDVTGQHYNRIKLDDFVTDDNSRSIERAERITAKFRSLTHLEEYKYDDDLGRLVGGVIPIQVTDTQYWVPNMITDVLDDGDVTAFIMPMTWDPDEHKTAYEYCKQHKYKIDPMVTNEFIDAKKTDSKSKEDFLSQYYMVGKERDAIVNLADDVRSFSFGYSDEWVPEGTAKINFDYDTLHSDNPISLSKDSSYSKKGKAQGDGQSNDVCIRCVHRDNIYYFTGEFSELGNLSLEGQKKSIILLSNDFYPDFVIVDSHSTQIFVSNQIFCSLQENEFKDEDYIEYVPYTKSRESDTPGKAATIQSVLSAMFQSGAVRVHWKLSKMIKQILRENKGFDFLDAMVQIMAIPQGTIDSAAYFKQLRNESMKKENGIILQKNNKSRTIFKTTGY